MGQNTHMNKELRRLLVLPSKGKTIKARSKQWWDEELTTQLSKVRRATPADYTQEAKSFKNMVKRKKECWYKFCMQWGNRDPWEVVRIAKDPFRIRGALGRSRPRRRPYWLPTTYDSYWDTTEVFFDLIFTEFR